MQIELDFAKARREADAGIAATAAANTTWMASALASLEGYARINAELTIEEFRKWWLDNGGEPPKHHNAWGALGRSAVLRNLLERTGFVPAKSVKTHGHPVAHYRSRIYKP